MRLTAITAAPVRLCYEAARRRDWPELERLIESSATRACALHQLLSAHHDSPRLLALAEQRARSPHLGREAVAMADALERAGRRNDAVTLLERSFVEESAPRDRLLLGDRLVTLLYAAHQNARAGQVRAALNAAVQRSRLPFLEYRTKVISPGSSSPQTLYLLAGRLAERHQAYAHCAIALNNLVHDEIDRGRMQAALRDAPHALSCADRSGSDYQRAYSRVFYGRALSKSGQQGAAEKMLLAAWRYADRSGPRYLRAEVWHNLAHVYEAQARWPAAQRAVERFVATTEPTGESQQIVAYRDAGIIYWDSGDLLRARARLDRMVQLVERYHHEYFWAGEYYERVGDLARARTYYVRALSQEGNDARKTAGLARVYLALEELDSAAVFARMHDAAPLTPEEVLLAPVVEAARGHYDAALKTSAAWAYREEAQRNVIGAINAHLQRAELAIAAGRYTEAELAARRARALASSSNLKAEAALALAYLGTAQNARGARAGIKLLQNAVAEARAIARENLRSVVWAAVADAYVRVGASRDALAAFDSAAAARQTAGHFEDSFDRARYRSAMSLRLTHAAWSAVRNAQPALLYEWSVRRKAGAVPRQSLARVQAALPRDGAMLDYLVADSGVAVLLITPTTTRVVRLAIDRAAVRALVQQFRGSIAVAFGSLDRTRSHFAYPAAQQLYEQLLQPLTPFLRTQDRWFISPDDALHLVPFDAFVDRQSGTSRFVIDDVATTYLSSVDALEQPRKVALRSVLAIGAAAPGWRSELAAIKSAVPSAAELMDPSETRVRSALSGATVLHFAVHAEADARQPRSSYLQLVAGENADGQYRFNEITSDHNQADLVVLSACETLYGRVFAGGPLSLASAFVTGGAKAVVATQWPVGDKSSEFARALYAQLARGALPADAVRAARLALRRVVGGDPIFWAPFELYVGSPR